MKKHSFHFVSKPSILNSLTKKAKKYDFCKKSIHGNSFEPLAIHANAGQKMFVDSCKKEFQYGLDDTDSVCLAEYRAVISNIAEPSERLYSKKNFWEMILQSLHIWNNDSYDVLRFAFYSKKDIPPQLKRVLRANKVKTDECANEKMLIKKLRRYHHEVLHCCVTDGIVKAVPFWVRLLVFDIERARPLAERMLSCATSVVCFDGVRDEVASQHFFEAFYKYVLRNVVFGRAYNNAVASLNSVNVEPKYTPVVLSGHTASIRGKNAAPK